MSVPMRDDPGWIEAEDNPFHVRIFDCRPFTRGAISTTSNPELAKRFLALRNDDGSQLRGSLPADAVETDCALRYSRNLSVGDGPLFRAREMEDKWDLDLVDRRIYIRRSWSGEIFFVAEVREVENGFEIPSLFCKRDPSGTEIGIANVDWLIKTYVLGWEVPHRVPRDLPDKEEVLTGYSFMVFGRAASFATYADATRIAPAERN